MWIFRTGLADMNVSYSVLLFVCLLIFLFPESSVECCPLSCHWLSSKIAHGELSAASNSARCVCSVHHCYKYWQLESYQLRFSLEARCWGHYVVWSSISDYLCLWFLLKCIDDVRIWILFRSLSFILLFDHSQNNWQSIFDVSVQSRSLYTQAERQETADQVLFSAKCEMT